MIFLSYNSDDFFLNKSIGDFFIKFIFQYKFQAPLMDS